MMTNEDTFNAGIKAFEQGKDVLDIPTYIDEDQIESFKDGYFYALDQSVDASRDGEDVIFNTPTYDDDEVDYQEGEHSEDEQAGQEVFDELFESIEALEEEI